MPRHRLPTPLRAATAALAAWSAACTYSILTVPPLADLESAPPAVVLSSGAIELHAELLRTFPSADASEGGPLTTLMRIEGQGGAPVPAGMTIDAVFLVYEGAVWSSRVTEKRPTDDDTFEFVIEKGPRWPVGTKADVVARVVPRGGIAFLLKAPDQRVQRVN